MSCVETCTRIRVALAEQDLDDAKYRVNRALEAISAAEDALTNARVDLHHAQAAERLRPTDLRHVRRATAT